MKIEKSTIKKYLLLLPIAVGAYMLAISWRKWFSITIDYGRELYIPWRLENGAVLYKDIYHIFGPLSHYFNSFLFKFFGTNIMTLVTFNILLIAVLTYLIYKIFQDFKDSITAVISITLFLGIFAFSQYLPNMGNCNYVCPYCHEILHAIVLAFIILYIFINYIKNPKPFLLFILGLLNGLVFLTKPEIFVSIFFSTGLGLLFILLREHFPVLPEYKNIKLEKLDLSPIKSHPFFKSSFKTSAVFFSGFIIPLLSFILYFSLHDSIRNAVGYVFFPYNLVINPTFTLKNRFYLNIAGFHNTSTHLLLILGVSFFYVIIIGIIKLSKLAAGKLSVQSRYWPMAIYLTVSFLVLSFLLYINLFWIYLWLTPLPFVMLGYWAFLAKRIKDSWNDIEQYNKLLKLFVFTTFSILLLLKTVLFTRISNYGFVLAMPSTLLLSFILTSELPKYIAKDKETARFIYAAGLFFLVITSIVHINASRRIYDTYIYPVGTKNEYTYTVGLEYSTEGIVFNQAIDFIEKNLKKNDTFVAIPEGLFLNYLTRHKNPVRYYEYTPHLIKFESEETVMAEFANHSPDYIMYIEMAYPWHGFKYFSKNYAYWFADWIDANYQTVRTIGQKPFTNGYFGVEIKKKDQKVIYLGVPRKLRALH